MLLNIPPDKRGLLNESDVQRLKELGKHLSDSKEDKLQIMAISAPKAEGDNVIEGVLTYEYDKTTYDPTAYYTPAIEEDSYEIEIALDGGKKINRVELIENTAFSQRIEKFEIYTCLGGKYKKVYDGTTVGFGRIATFKAVYADKVKIVLTSVRRKPYIEYIGVFADNGVVIRETSWQRFVKWIHHINYKIYVKRENKKRKKLNN